MYCKFSILFIFRLLSVVDDYLANVFLNPGEKVQQNEENIAVDSRIVNQTGFQGAAVESFDIKMMEKENDLVVHNNDYSVNVKKSRVSLTMKKSLFEKLKIDSSAQNQRIFFVIYRNHSFFQTDIKKSIDGTTVNTLNSWVISGSIKGQKLSNLKEPIVTTYKPLEAGTSKTAACVFWDFLSKDGYGGWSDSGCIYSGTSNDGTVTCKYSHLTNFAILMVGAYS